MRYPAYKPTGFKWLPEVPQGWAVESLRHMLRPFSEKGHPDAQLLSVVRDKGVIVRDIENDEENHNFIPDDLSGYKFVRIGQFVMNKMKAWQGSYGISDYEGIVSPAYFVFDLTSNVVPRFFHLAIRSCFYVPFFGRSSDGIRVGQWDLSMDRMKEIPFLIPPPDEQKAIVAYLDDKTAKIDRLIKLKEREIELLQEKKQAMISKVVTRGLDPNAKLVDSGVDWIGKVPCGWKVVPFKSLFRFGKGLMITKDDLTEAGENVISYGQIHSKMNGGVHLDTSLLRHVPARLTTENARLNPGDIVFADTSEDIPGCGNCVLIDADETVYAGYHTLIARATKKECSPYLAALFQSVSWRRQVWKKVNGVKVFSVSQKVFSGMTVCIPPLAEQREIVAYLDAESAKTDRAIAVVRRQIDLLREYRTRLISDVVTGRIDVREVVA